jgi:hypothetical protein
MSNGNAPTLQRVCSCEENCRRTYTDWTAVSPETTETGVADLFYTVLFNGESAFATANQGFRRGLIVLLLALNVIFVDPPQNIFQIGEEVSAIYSVEYIKV